MKNTRECSFRPGRGRQLSDKLGFYMSGDCTIDTGDEDRKTFEGNLGMRVTW